MTLHTLAEFDVDQFLTEAVRAAKGPAVWGPACNAYEDDHGFWVEAALPGIDRKAVEVVFEDGVLTVKGERKDNVAGSPRTYFAREIGWGGFYRSFRLPTNVDSSKISASYHEGILTVQVPKREETKPRQILVE